jgi:hypothetical protein
MSVEAPCFPVIQDINDFRELCFEINYDHPDISNAEVPLPNAIAACIAHKVFSVICIPANLLGVAIATVGTLGSCVLAAMKISVYVFSGHRCTFSTGYNYFSAAARGSFYQIFKTVGENLFEYFYRFTSAFDAVVCPRNREEIPAEWKTLPLVEDLNRVRTSLREGEREIGKWFLHKLISIINIPANIATSVISAIGISVGAALVTAKVATYIFIGIKIQHSTGFEYFFKSFSVANGQLLRNIGELGKDSIVLVGDVANLLGMQGALERASDFANNAFRRFSEALLG